jgi:transposase
MRATYGDALPSFVKRQLEAIEDVSEQVKAADAEIDSIANADALCVRLRGVPGVGPVTAVCFTAVIDAVGRFPNAKAVYSYLGLSPGERSSSSTIRRTGLTKAGSPRLRRLLVQCAWQLWRLKPQSALANWANQIAARRGKGIAVVAVARKLAGILFAMWRDGSTYAPSLAAQS